MTWEKEEIEELKSFGPVQVASEGDVTFFLISNLKLPSGCIPEAVDALLCPVPRDGYLHRLFFAQKIETKHTPKTPPNWNALNQYILEKNWNAYSWKTNTPNLRLAQMVADHLVGLR